MGTLEKAREYARNGMSLYMAQATNRIFTVRI